MLLAQSVKSQGSGDSVPDRREDAEDQAERLNKRLREYVRTGGAGIGFDQQV
jgi:hypothetical protein